MIDPLARWHEECDRATAAREASRVRRFGLHPVGDDSRTTQRSLGFRVPGEVWAWQGVERATEDLPHEGSPVRVGFAGRRLHAGHLGLASTAAELAGPNGRIIVFDATLGSEGSMLDRFLGALRHYTCGEPVVSVVRDAPALARLQREALGTLRMSQLRQVYGWDDGTHLDAIADVADMLGFFLFDPDGRDGPGAALVDVLQAPHAVGLRRAARALHLRAPVLLHRRLFPHLRRQDGRGTAREPGSVLFADDDERIVRAKFAGARTGGRATLAEQQALGGDPTRCVAFAMIELLCSRATAETALLRCRSGETSCVDCKRNHLDAVAASVTEIAGSWSAPQARASADVGPAVHAAARTLHRPPPREAADLEAAIAARNGVAAEQVVVGHGSTEIMDWLFRLQARPGGRVVATEPAFELFPQLADRHRMEYIRVPWEEHSFTHDLPALARAIDSRTAVCVVELPHSVSGSAIPLTRVLDDLAGRLPERARLLVDLAYADFAEQPPRLTPGLLEAHPQVAFCRSLSKAHCLLGARVGYALTAGAPAAELRTQRLPYAVDSLALAAARGAVDDEATVRETVAANRIARELLTSALSELGIAYARTEANFLLMNPGHHRDPLVRVLKERGPRFRDGARWGLLGWVQVHLIDTSVVQPVIRAIRDTVIRDNGLRTHGAAIFSKEPTIP